MTRIPAIEVDTHQSQQMGTMKIDYTDTMLTRHLQAAIGDVEIGQEPRSSTVGSGQLSLQAAMTHSSKNESKHMQQESDDSVTMTTQNHRHAQPQQPHEQIEQRLTRAQTRQARERQQQQQLPMIDIKNNFESSDTDSDGTTSNEDSDLSQELTSDPDRATSSDDSDLPRELTSDSSAQDSDFALVSAVVVKMSNTHIWKPKSDGSNTQKRAAYKEEMDNLARVIVSTPLTERPTDTTRLRCMTLLTEKAQERSPDVGHWKVRSVALGQQEENITKEQRHVSMTSRTTLRLCNIEAHIRGMHTEIRDVSRAYLNAPINRNVEIIPPDRQRWPKIPGHYYRLTSSLYGMPDAGNNWQATLHKHLTADGGIRCDFDRALYVFPEQDTLLATHVDDLKLQGTISGIC